MRHKISIKNGETVFVDIDENSTKWDGGFIFLTSIDNKEYAFNSQEVNYIIPTEEQAGRVLKPLSPVDFKEREQREKDAQIDKLYEVPTV